MDTLLQEHNAKHIYKVPEGLRELCSDISREVLRSQPKNIYSFIADYIEALLITRENAKVAVKVVQNIVIDSESIVNVLRKTGLSFEQIALAAPQLQETFRVYLDAVDTKPGPTLTNENLEKESQISIGNILRETGATLADANKAATLIQTAFRTHYQKMLEREEKGEIQWQRAVVNTMSILRKAGISQNEASKTAALIQSVYRGYYTRRNINMKMRDEEKKKHANYLEPRETIQAVAWLDMMLFDSGFTKEQAVAASVIQKAYRTYKKKKRSREVPQIKSSRSLVVQAILDNLHRKVFNNILSRENYPKELGSRKELSESIEKVQSTYKGLLRKSQYFNGETKTEIEELIYSEEELVENKFDYEETKVQTKTAEVKIEEETEDLEIEENKEDQENEENQEKHKIQDVQENHGIQDLENSYHDVDHHREDNNTDHTENNDDEKE